MNVFKLFKTYCKCSFFVQADESGIQLRSKLTKMCQCNQLIPRESNLHAIRNKQTRLR